MKKISVEFVSELPVVDCLCVFQNQEGEKCTTDKMAETACKDLAISGKLEASTRFVTSNGNVLVVPMSRKKAYSDLEFFRFAGATCASGTKGWKKIAIGHSEFSSHDAAQVAFGFLLSCYTFDKYKEKKSERSTEKIFVYSPNPIDSEHLFNRLSVVLEGIFLAKDLANEPANIMTPAEFVKRCKFAMKSYGLKIIVLGEKDMKKLGFGALLGVGQGSVQESKTLVMEWKGSGDKPVALIGKGVTFDTGGISIKPSRRMEEMVFDMCGAAAVAGTMITLAKSKAKAHVVGAVGLVENMPGGAAQRPGDVVKSYCGKTIQVLNTDAEGRLVLADVMGYIQDKYKPSTVIDLATLTGAVLVALGHRYAALCSNSSELCKTLLACSEESGDLVWNLPLSEYYNESMNSKVADVANVETVRTGAAGTITAAEFLQRFVKEGVEWAHLDIAGTATVERSSPLCAYGATGFGVAILERLISGKY